MDLNIKSMVIDADRCVSITAAQNPVQTVVNFVRGNTYIIQANCYANSYDTNVASFSNTDSWSLYVGDQYESNASPVIAITNQALWNNTSDWSFANVSAGLICCKVNVNGTALTADMANVANENYTMQIVANNSSNILMVCSVPAYIRNSVQL